MAKRIISIPTAARTFTALADLGYDLNSAIADILDNSISQGQAKNIHIFFFADQKNKYKIRIIDDGIGMTKDDLQNAMQLGSGNDDYSKGNLSKYGFGMKTASLSQCNSLTVLSKTHLSEISGFTWDMNHVKKTNKWELLENEPDEIVSYKQNLISELHLKIGNEIADKILALYHFTAVIWDDLHTFQENFDRYDSDRVAVNYYHRTLDKLTIYLRLIFHRFLAGENNASQISIHINGRSIKPLDPFCRNQSKTYYMPLPEKDENFIIKSGMDPIIIKRYVLPTNPLKPGEFKFSSYEAWEEAKGVLSWNDAQGYYVYRNNRLINFGGWQSTKNKDEHDKLARASIDLTEEHDELFTLDVKKTRIQFPEILRNHLKDKVNKVFISEAKRRYAGSEKKKQEIVNSVRTKAKKVSHLSSQLTTEDEIRVHQDRNTLTIVNRYGSKISDDLTYKILEAGQKLISQPFGDDKVLWKMIPNPDNEFQVLINSDHPFYEVVYGNAERDKKITAIMDAFLFTMSFIELKCITSSNEFLFEQMSEVASSVLKQFVDDQIL